VSDPYLWLKWLHVMSATVLFGTGLGTALHMWLAHLRRDPRAIAVVARNVVLVDWLLTATSGVVQPLSGIGLVYLSAADPFASWLVVRPPPRSTAKRRCRRNTIAACALGSGLVGRPS